MDTQQVTIDFYAKSSHVTVEQLKGVLSVRSYQNSHK